MEAINQFLNVVAVFASGMSIGMSIVMFLFAGRIAAIERRIRTSFCAARPASTFTANGDVFTESGKTVMSKGIDGVNESSVSSEFGFPSR